MLPLNILNNIHGHNDLVKLSDTQRLELCQEIRQFLVENISKTGGHLASNLGAVELTVAIETVYDTHKDRLVFDVGHQSYVHKILTGRQAAFSTLRQFGGIAGFPKPAECDADAFTAGHASSSVSIALGMARARTRMNQDYHVVAMLGDGAATGGTAFEGLNDASVSNEPMVIILNDNAMSIDRNVGGMASHFSHLRTKKKYLGIKEKYKNTMSKIPGGKWMFRVTRSIKDAFRRMLIPSTIFESMGFTYLGPVDGHDVNNLIALLKFAKEMNRPVILHAVTQKGKGYKPAEERPKLFHGVGKFDAATGEVPEKTDKTFSSSFGEMMVRLAKDNKNLCAITAAMPGGTGLLDFKKQYPDRLFDVGIAEEHAVSMAGGLAKQGMVPVVAIYSTFLQRAFDMLIQDVALQNLHVVFCIDRAGLVGEDGETHHGVFDVGYLRQVPGMKVLCPASCEELDKMLEWAVNDYNGPVAIRYPRGGDKAFQDSAWNENSNMVFTHCCGSDATVVTYGTMLDNAEKAVSMLQEKNSSLTLLRLLCVNPIPIAELCESLPKDKPVFVIEEVHAASGIYSGIAYELQKMGRKERVYGLNLGEGFVAHGSMAALYNMVKLDPESIAEYIQEVLKDEN